MPIIDYQENNLENPEIVDSSSIRYTGETLWRGVSPNSQPQQVSLRLTSLYFF